MMNVSKNRCVGCGLCEDICPVGCISVDIETGIAVLDRQGCTDCGICVNGCPQKAIMDIGSDLVYAIGTDDNETIKPDDHFGMSLYFQIWRYSNGRSDLLEIRENAKYREDESRIHGDPKKAKATSSVLGGVDIIVGKMMGPNITRLKDRFVPVVVREPSIEKANEIIRYNINEIMEENEKEDRRGLVIG